MTVGELIKELGRYDLDAKVRITYTCDNDYRPVDTVRYIHAPDSIVIESHSIPDFDDLQVIAREVFEEHGKYMSRSEQRIMLDFIK